MKYVVILITMWFLGATKSAGQSIRFQDGFEDGDFNSAPSWTGDTNDFTVTDAYSTNFALSLEASGSGASYLSTPQGSIDGQGVYWKFYLKLRDASFSGSNQAEIFLVSKKSNLENSPSGYALQLGESGDDFLKIVRYDDGSEAATVVTDTTNIKGDTGYTVQVSRNANGKWQISAATGYGTALHTSDNSGIDDTYTDAGYFGVRVNYTSTRADKFLFDFKIDLPPLVISTISASGQQVNISFNQPVNQSTAQASGFSLNHGYGSPADISFPEDGTVQLNYGSSLPSQKYQLTVNNIDDQNGNPIAMNTTSSFSIYGDYEPGDIIINEFMYDPPGDLEEYVEIKNISDKFLNLSNWEIGDETGTDDLGGNTITIEANSFLVISSDTSVLHDKFGNGPYYKFSKLAAYNNGGDAIQLVTNKGSLADSLTYTPNWGGDNVAVERRADTVPSTLKSNFGNSPNLKGGSPGFTNQISVDKTPPSLKAHRLVNNSTIKLIFSEAVDPQSASNQNRYSISPGRNIQLISSLQDTVTLFLGQPLQSGATYQLTISGIQDYFGNTLKNMSFDMTYVEYSQARPGDIIINEILYTRKNAGDPEFVELYNPTSKNFDLSGWTVGDARGTVSLEPGTHLPADGYLILTADGKLANSVKNGVRISDFPSLNDNGDALYLQNGFQTTIDSLFYTPAFGGTPDGTSAERKDPEAASNDPSNFASSTASSGYTPGAKNSAYQLDERPPRPIFAQPISPNRIEVRFNEFIQKTPDLSFTLEKGEPLSVSSFDSTDANTITLTSPGAISTGSEQVIHIRHLSDVKGNKADQQAASSSQIPLAQNLSPEDVVINEIMYNPLDKSDDNQPDQSEYLELKNTRGYAVSLQGITLHDQPDEDKEVRTLNPVSTQSKWIPAEGTALVYADEAPTFAQSKIVHFFYLNGISPATLMRINRSSLSLSSSDDAIYLADSLGTNIDSVFYDESWQNPNLVDTRGIALERISPAGPSNNKSNWGSSVAPKGGTPALENSIHQDASSQSSPTEIGMHFSPNPFSPDGDGYEDHLFISYKLDQPDYLLNVRIYDRYGRLVNRLADGKAAGLKGKLIWNGRKKNGGRNRIGIYIVVFKAYNSEAGKNLSFKKPVVIARKLN